MSDSQLVGLAKDFFQNSLDSSPTSAIMRGHKKYFDQIIITNFGSGYAAGDQLIMSAGTIPGVQNNVVLTIQPYNLFTNSVGCDSTHTLNLTINNSTTSSSSATACDSYNWNGTTYTSSGVYTDTLINSVGCDSIATLNLTINNSTSSTTIVDTCVAYDSTATFRYVRIFVKFV